jgi:hypothetical protein
MGAAERKEREMIRAFTTTTDGLRDANMDVLEHARGLETVRQFLNGQTGGTKLVYAIDTQNKRVAKVFRKGKFAQRDAQALLRAGFDAFAFSWAWAPSTWEINGETVEVSESIDVVKGDLVR